VFAAIGYICLLYVP